MTVAALLCVPFAKPPAASRGDAEDHPDAAVATSPGLPRRAKATTPRGWVVNGVERSAAHVVSADAEGRPIYGGTPAHSAMAQAIQELRVRGVRLNSARKASRS